MSIAKKLLAGLAAAGLLVSQSAAAAALPARAGADIGQAEELAGTPPGSAPVIAVILGMLLIFGIMALTDDDDDDFPVSP